MDAMENVWIDTTSSYEIIFFLILYQHLCISVLYYRIYVLLFQYFHRLPPGLRCLINR